MKWFKHDSDASLDAKLQRLRLKYGLEGYGLYWFCLEAIARNVEPHNLSFELEEDAELISAVTGIHHERIEEMMLFMVDMGLFEESCGRITCLKMASRTDEYTQKLLRNSSNVRTISRHTPEKVPPIRIEQNRTEQKRKEGATRKTSLPKNFEVTDLMRDWVVNNLPDLDYEAATSRWITSMAASGRKYACWRSAWQNGMRKADEWRREKEPANNHAELLEAIRDL